MKLPELRSVKRPFDTQAENVYAGFPEQLVPIAEFIDGSTGGWALSYADLSPEDETTPAGVAFLLTNVSFLIVGALLWSKGLVALGLATEVAGVVSYIYHYNQLASRGKNSPAVKLSLLVDYFTAGSALIIGSGYLTSEISDRLFSGETLSIFSLLSSSSDLAAAIGCSVLAVVSLGLCWVWEYGTPYLILHSLWHRKCCSVAVLQCCSVVLLQCCAQRISERESTEIFFSTPSIMIPKTREEVQEAYSQSSQLNNILIIIIASLVLQLPTNISCPTQLSLAATLPAVFSAGACYLIGIAAL